MPEGISENLPPDKPGIVKRITWAIKERLPWDPVGKKKRSIEPFPKDIAPKKPQVRIVPEENEQEPNILPSIEQNIKASERFIQSIRDPNQYSQDSHNPQYLKGNLGFLVEKPVEKGWFDVSSVLKTANDRYQLPLAIYIDHNHARLVVKGAYQTPEGRKITVYNPMSNGFKEVSVNKTGMLIGVTSNGLIRGKIDRGEYDIKSFLEDARFREYRGLLENIKAFGFQKDLRNCIPYCLFVSAMLHGLESGATEFKRQGIKQFEQDFGVRIITREDIIPKPRVRIVD